MPENNENLDWVLGSVDLSAVDISQSASVVQWNSVEWSTNVPVSNISLDDLANIQQEWLDASKLVNLDVDNPAPAQTIDESVFLDAWWDTRIQTRADDAEEHFWKYLRWFFFSSVIILIWVVAIVGLFAFNSYITKASQSTIDIKDQEFITKFKDKYEKVKTWIWKDNKDNYQTPSIAWDESIATSRVNEIINASDIDYIDKKDILSPYASDLIRNAQEKANQIEAIKQDIARQWFLPAELDTILSDDEAIDTIQRSLNALEVIKFSTATKVFSYMDTALATIASMVRVNWSSQESIWQLLNQLSNRWEKDISAYVYMCYLNPFEASASCDTIWDLDLYYNSILHDNSINIKLFKNTMNAINQLLEKEDSALFSITFNWFNAQDKNITFNIEVYTTQSDERSLMAKGKKNPNIFILTNIVNLLKQSSFIIGSEINTREVNVETRNITLWWLTTFVNYSSKDFTVPIQKDTEREIFDYIDIDSINQLLQKKTWVVYEESQEEETNYFEEITQNTEVEEYSEAWEQQDENTIESETQNEIEQEVIDETEAEGQNNLWEGELEDNSNENLNTDNSL